MSDELQDLKAVQDANVYKAGVLAAHLTRHRDGSVAFNYADTYAGPSIASTLQLGMPERVTTNGGLPTYFTNLLPEGRRMVALRRALAASGDDDLTMLLAVGGDLVGDVQVLPKGTALPPAPVAANRPASFDTVDFSQLLADRLGFTGLAASGIAGVQDKVSSAMITLPYRGDYLLKLSPPEFRHLVENENFFLTAAHDSGIRTVDHALVHDREGRSALAVERFDRQPSPLLPRSLAVEDACQVLDVYPSQKYSVTTEQVLQSLSARCGAPVVAALELFAQVVFAYLSGNGDAHAKNFSIMALPTGEWRVAPAYDLPSTRPYDDTTLALSIGGKRRGLTRRDLVAMAGSAGLRERPATRVLDNVLAAMDSWVERLDELPFDPQRIHRLRRFVLDRRTALSAP